MKREEYSFDQCMEEPGVYYNPDNGTIIRISKVSPLLYESEKLATGKKGGEPSSVCIKISNDPGLNDDEVEGIIRERKL